MQLFEVYSDLSSFSEKTDIYGDFAHILWEGNASKKTRNIPSPEIYIERLGPDVPEAYVSNRSLIVSQKIKDSLFTSGLTGFTAILAVKNKIIKCDWKNLSEDYFEKYYSIDDVIDKGRHNQSIADKMPNLWWIKANDYISFHKKSSQEWDYVINNESDFYYGAGDKLGVFVSEKAKSFMESLCLPLKYNEL